MILRIGFVLASVAVFSFGQARDYGRSMVITQQGIAATSHTLASQAGAQILAKGGSAVDAAIAANAVLGVVEPMMDGIGGDLFVIYWDAKSGKLTGLNASGPAPRALSAEFLTNFDRFNLSAQEGYLVSLIDGRLDLSKLLILSPFDAFNTLFHFAKLQNERAIVVPQ